MSSLSRGLGLTLLGSFAFLGMPASARQHAQDYASSNPNNISQSENSIIGPKTVWTFSSAYIAKGPTFKINGSIGYVSEIPLPDSKKRLIFNILKFDSNGSVNGIQTIGSLNTSANFGSSPDYSFIDGSNSLFVVTRNQNGLYNISEISSARGAQNIATVVKKSDIYSLPTSSGFNIFAIPNPTNPQDALLIKSGSVINWQLPNGAEFIGSAKEGGLILSDQNNNYFNTTDGKEYYPYPPQTSLVQILASEHVPVSTKSQFGDCTVEINNDLLKVSVQSEDFNGSLELGNANALHPIKNSADFFYVITSDGIKAISLKKSTREEFNKQLAQQEKDILFKAALETLTNSLRQKASNGNLSEQDANQLAESFINQIGSGQIDIRKDNEIWSKLVITTEHSVITLFPNGTLGIANK